MRLAPAVVITAVAGRHLKAFCEVIGFLAGPPDCGLLTANVATKLALGKG